MAAFFEGFSELLSGAGVPLMISTCASAVFFLRHGVHGWRHFWGHASASLFIGQMVFWALDYYPELGFTVKCAVTGFAAYSGGRVLDSLLKRIRREVAERPLPLRLSDRKNKE